MSSIMGGQRCLDVYGDGTTPGTPVDSASCNGTRAQVWYYYNGEVLSHKTQYCLDATNNGERYTACHQSVQRCNKPELADEALSHLGRYLLSRTL